MSSDERSPALEALFWREEILQVLYWMQGERLAESVSAGDLQPLLQGTADVIEHHLQRCREDGYLVRDPVDAQPPRYCLSDWGRREAGRLFADAVAGMQGQGHGECDPDCVCFTEGPHACPSHHHDHA